MSTVKQTTEQLVLAGVIFSKSVLNKKENTATNSYPVLDIFINQPESVRAEMVREKGDIFGRYYRAPQSRNAGSKVLKEMSKTSQFKKDSNGELYISELFEVKPKDYISVVVGKGKNKSLFTIPAQGDVEEKSIPIHQSQDTLFFMATNKTIKNTAVSAGDILGVKVKGKRKKKVDYSSNDVIISKKENINLVNEIALDDVIAEANAKVTTNRVVKSKLGFMDEIVEKKED